MHLKGKPFDVERDFFAHDVDNGLADVTERSDVIEINTHFDRHKDLHRLRMKIEELLVKLNESENGSLRMPVLNHKIVFFAPELWGQDGTLLHGMVTVQVIYDR
jgi:hypothetical protein